MTVAGDSDDQLQVSNQSSSASENEDATKPGTSGSATTKRSLLTQALNEMTEQTERLSATSSGNEEVDDVGNVDVKVDDVKVDHDVELSGGETFEQHQPFWGYFSSDDDE